jgi:exopolysaccharide biosynthesis WecB/TagA/CpsF family protein
MFRDSDKTAARPGIELQLDDFDLPGFMAVASRFGQERFGYMVTPNVDHFIRYYDDAEFRAAYAAATFVLLDSRVLARMVRIRSGLSLKVCPGSDVTDRLFAEVIRPEDVVVMIGGTEAQAAQLAAQRGLRQLRHYNPPMGFIRDERAVDECLAFVERHGPFRFCLLAVGAPQQEFLAQRLQERGRARGLVLCVGASVNFLTGVERRAPRWMQRAGLEWAFRLMQDPGRLARRYLVRGPRSFLLLWKVRIVARKPRECPS